jgi:hypothetical protein
MFDEREKSVIPITVLLYAADKFNDELNNSTNLTLLIQENRTNQKADHTRGAHTPPQNNTN